MFRKSNTAAQIDDSALVIQSLGGDRDAFCEIVARYQNLLCSLAYSSVGDIKLSEDIAQESFIEAWKKLDTLREPQKLKAWLCGILRFKVSLFRRKADKDVGKAGLEITDDVNVTDESGDLDSQAIQDQQETLMWRVLNELDETYREPLILFYREQQSVERVAQELDIEVPAAKQRLSRGRKLLKQAMSSFVEDALQKTKPGAAFTLAVYTAISGIAPPAKAAALGVGASKASSVLKLAPFITLLAVLSGFVSAFFGLRAGLDQSRTNNEKHFVIRIVASYMLLAIVYVLGMFGLKHLALESESSAALYSGIAHTLVALFTLSYLLLAYRTPVSLKNLRARERLFNPKAFSDSSNDKKSRETISRIRILGAPLYHFQFGLPEHGEQPAFGWIAGGTEARGLLFAWGGVAIAPVSVGIVSFGVISIGAVGFGLFSLGTVAIGVIAFGASAIGYKAYSSLSSMGWESAVSGGFSWANDAALGAIAFAKNVNNQAAVDISHLDAFSSNYHWALLILAVFVIVPAVLYSHSVRKRFRQTS
ncbi:sigma-70 family RNA polymerase sigma factor [Alteromonas sp. KUL49]|uniref:RNA polymerase sigma factor n=1 Tax=Alteromonas sp. KUL49 TaxID=2480798 RepID=UPI00102F010C|nr:sigma-70 family RNA polymerase sigma factor [Alteromonas sp. KUL49]TAP39372.1 sigma-70 family RNA polymerase sigma factor [Alteromonas sp. KUL49]GEA12167.1 DNA-directed RNA polymerase sigma-70 factor [Alteromonas sp. KUL49]